MDTDVSHSTRIAQPAKQILSYFVRNPSAADTLEGIAKWRLLEETIHRNVAETEEALQWLVKEGYLIEMPQPYGSRIFHLNSEMQAQAESILGAAAHPDEFKGN